MIAKRLIASLTLVSFICACEQKNTTSEKKEVTIAAPGKEQTYLYFNNGDTVRLELDESKNPVTGKLDFLPYEKDSRRGTLQNGQFSGDTLFAIYHSTQEGQYSECEIALLKQSDAYVISNDFFGKLNYEYYEDYTKGRFKNKHQVKFDGNTLKKVQ